MGKGGPELASYMEKTLSLKMDAGRHIEGVLRGYDPFLNIVLDQVSRVLASRMLSTWLMLTLPSGTRNCGPAAHAFGIDRKLSLNFSPHPHPPSLSAPRARVASPDFFMAFVAVRCVLSAVSCASLALSCIAPTSLISLPSGHSWRQHPHHGVPSARRSVSSSCSFDL